MVLINAWYKRDKRELILNVILILNSTFKIFYRNGFKKNELGYLREIFKKMLLFGNLNQDPIKELLDFVIKEGRANDFAASNSSINEQVRNSNNTENDQFDFFLN